jgi:AGZA family xanthine/uracil permease-like MFS transporter
VAIGNLTSHSVLLGVLGFFIIAVLASRNIHAAVLISIVVTTLLGWMMGDVQYHGIISAPPSVASVVGNVDLAGHSTLAWQALSSPLCWLTSLTPPVPCSV